MVSLYVDLYDFSSHSLKNLVVDIYPQPWAHNWASLPCLAEHDRVGRDVLCQEMRTERPLRRLQLRQVGCKVPTRR